MIDIIGIFGNLRKTFCDTFFPKYCINCLKEGNFICENCFSEIKIKNDPIENISDPQIVLKKIFIPCVFSKNPILKKAVHRMKYTYYQDIADDLSKLLINVFEKFPLPGNTHLIPIPLHKKKLKLRGFNQSEILSQYISKKINSPYVNLLKRIKNTDSQATLSREERIKNTKNAFQINKNIQVPCDTPLLIVDDICTTLSTMNEAAKTLQNNGYNIIFGAALARG